MWHREAQSGCNPAAQAGPGQQCGFHAALNPSGASDQHGRASTPRWSQAPALCLVFLNASALFCSARETAEFSLREPCAPGKASRALVKAAGESETPLPSVKRKRKRGAGVGGGASFPGQASSLTSQIPAWPLPGRESCALRRKWRTREFRKVPAF